MPTGCLQRSKSRGSEIIGLVVPRSEAGLQGSFENLLLELLWFIKSLCLETLTLYREKKKAQQLHYDIARLKCRGAHTEVSDFRRPGSCRVRATRL